MMYSVITHRSEGEELGNSEEDSGNITRSIEKGRRARIITLRCLHDAVGQGVFDQIRGGLEIELRQNLALMKLNRP